MPKRNFPTGRAWLSTLAQRWRLFVLTTASVAIVTALTGLLLQDRSSLAQPSVDAEPVQLEQQARGQLMRYQQLLEAAQAEQSELTQKSSGTTDVDIAYIQQRLRELTVKQEDYDERIEVLVQKRRALTTWVEDQPHNIARRIERANPQKLRLIERQRGLQDELFAKRNGPGKPTAEHPDVRRLIDAVAQVQREIDATQGKVEVETQAVPNTARIDAERQMKLMTGELAALQSRRDSVVQAINKMATTQRDRAAADNRIVVLTNDIAEYRRQVRAWDKRWRVVQAQTADTSPSTGAGLIIEMLLAAGALGAGIGGVATLGVELRHRAYRSVQDAADRLDLPVLGAVDQVAA